MGRWCWATAEIAGKALTTCADSSRRVLEAVAVAAENLGLTPSVLGV
jgi:hypothetical protein